MNAAIRELISEIVPKGSPIAPVVANAPPKDPTLGTLWWDSVGGALYVWRGGAWIGLTLPLRPDGDR
jgi:hypothetical protein